MACKVWHAKEAVIKLGMASAVTITTAAALDTFFTGSGTAILTGIMKDVSIKEPIGDVGIINLMGTDSQAFPNMEMEEKPADLVEVSGTMLLPGDRYTEALMYGTGGSARIAISTTHARSRGGIANLSTAKVALLLNLDDSTDEVNYAGDNMLMTSREVKVTGADGHFEVSVTLKCLPRDWYGPEFKL